MAKTRWIVCCDGTWNTPDEVKDGQACPTNVAKIAMAISGGPNQAGISQRVHYHKGVGTGKFDHFRGGALGWGLSKNVQDAYMFLVENYDETGPDEIFLFGFSRGAYTARSVAGLIRNSGLLRRQYAGKLDEAYALYRDRTDETHPNAMESRLFRKSYATEVRINFIGVWDTVGALGIPVDFPGVQLFNDYWKFHDVQLSTFVDNAFQALAIDERRKPFGPSIWQQQPNAVNQRLEQVWFAGVHSDIGGGYPQTGLSDIALAWMADRAAQCGLELSFKNAGIAVMREAGMPLHDSMTWYYRAFGQLIRPMPVPRRDHKGQVVVTNEMVSDQAVLRKSLVSYHAPNVEKFLKSGGKQMTT